MAFVLPSTVSAGSVLTASTWNQVTRENQKFGMATFANAADRDAAMTSPEEGQMAYLTAPAAATVTATGGSTFVPSGVVTIYNGSAWVCTTPVGAYTSNSGTTTSGTFTATLSGSPGTNPSATLPTGTTALVHMTSFAQQNANANIHLGVAVSGASTVSAIDTAFTYASYTGNAILLSYSYILDGLTAGVNTFTLQYKVGAGTGTYQYRRISVQGIA